MEPIVETPTSTKTGALRQPTPNRVLIVDDNPQNIQALQAVLGDMHLELLTADSGEVALRHLLKTDVALILLDVKMPVMDGFETARLVRQRERSANTPIIFLTAYQSDEAQIFEGYQSGAVDYISKPVNAKILRSKVAVFMDLFDKTRQLRSMNETLEQQVAARTAALRAAEAKFRHIFENAMDGIYQVNDQRKFTIANPAMAAILGFPDSESLIGGVQDVRRDIYLNVEDHEALMAEIGKNGYVTGLEWSMRRRDGRLIWVSESARAIYDDNGRAVGYEGILRDITERKRSEEERISKNKDLQTLLYVTSHDLKEPLRGILGYSREIAEAKEDMRPEVQRERLGRIVHEAKRLESLLDNVRILIQAQQMSADMQPVTAVRLVEQSLAPLQHRIHETGAQITLGDNLPVLIANERWVIHAISNLVANALKFAKPGEKPIIDIHPCPIEKCGPGSGLIIRDRGIGVPPAHRERIFDLFKKGGNHKMEGSGAGLAIVSQIARGHGGRVWVEDRDGGGSDFYLVLGAPHGEMTPTGGSRMVKAPVS